jgi:hypothetical protein
VTIADRIVVLDKGRIIQHGTPEDCWPNRTVCSVSCGIYRTSAPAAFPPRQIPTRASRAPRDRLGHRTNRDTCWVILAVPRPDGDQSATAHHLTSKLRRYGLQALCLRKSALTTLAIVSEETSILGGRPRAGPAPPHGTASTPTAPRHFSVLRSTSSLYGTGCVRRRQMSYP